MRVDIICDLETLGVAKDSTIIQIAAACFDITTGDVIDTFNECVDISKEPISAMGRTITWWLNTNKDLFADILQRGSCSQTDVLKHFHTWLTEDIDKLIDVPAGETLQKYFWGNGILFDNAIVQAHFEQVGLTYPIFYRNDRDLRTLVELASLKSGRSESEIKDSVPAPAQAHDAMNDVLYEIAWAHECWKILMK